MSDQQLAEVSEKEEIKIREQHNEFVLVSRASSDNCSLHLPDGEKPLCGRTVAKRDNHYETRDAWKRKSTKVYPPGHKDICRYCAAEWREQE